MTGPKNAMRLPSGPGTWMTGVPTSMPTGFIPAKWLSRSWAAYSVDSAEAARADRPPTLCQTLLVSLGKVVATLVEDRQAHHMETDVDGADLLHFQQPSGGDPGPRAARVEPHVCDNAIFCHGGDHLTGERVGYPI